MKPFFDAFYGPHTRRFRYWPGLLLLARVGIYQSSTFSSRAREYFYGSLIISVAITILLCLWILQLVPFLFTEKPSQMSWSFFSCRILDYLQLFQHPWQMMISYISKFWLWCWLAAQELCSVASCCTTFLASSPKCAKKIATFSTYSRKQILSVIHHYFQHNVSFN